MGPRSQLLKVLPGYYPVGCTPRCTAQAHATHPHPEGAQEEHSVALSFLACVPRQASSTFHASCHCSCATASRPRDHSLLGGRLERPAHIHAGQGALRWLSLHPRSVHVDSERLTNSRRWLTARHQAVRKPSCSKRMTRGFGYIPRGAPHQSWPWAARKVRNENGAVSWSDPVNESCGCLSQREELCLPAPTAAVSPCCRLPPSVYLSQHTALLIG